MSGHVALVGAGPGDPGLLTVRAARRIAEAEVLIFDALASDPIVELAPPTCEKIYVGKRAAHHTMPQEEISRLLVEYARRGKRVVRLKGGDPFVFGRGGEEAQELHAAGIEFEVIPGISSALAAPAYAGIPVTHRAFNTNFTVATGHENPEKGPSTLDWRALGAAHGTAVFLMGMGNLETITRQLLANGRSPDTPAAIISDGTTPRQRTVVGTLATIEEVSAAAKMQAPAVIVVGEAVSVRDEVRWFDRRPLFGKSVLLTRSAADSTALAARLWECGARPLAAPLLRIAEPSDPRPATAAMARLIEAGAAYDWVLFTSRNGVCAFAEALHASRCDARTLASVKIGAIGNGTADEVRKLGIVPDCIPAEPSSEGFIASLCAILDTPARVLVWGAENGRDVLGRGLRARGHEVTEVAAYRTVGEAPPALDELMDAADILTFCSGAAVRAFVAAVPDAATKIAGRRVVCVAGSAVLAARMHDLPVHAVAPEAHTAALFTAINGCAALN